MAYRLHSLVLRLPLACALLACGAIFGQEGKNPPRGKGVPASLEATVDRAARILIALQEDLDGGESPYEWPYEGVYRENARIPIGYRVGGTSICAWSLIETPIYSTDSELREAVGRSLDFVLRKLGHDRMSADFNGRYDVRGWGHTYALTFLLRLRARGLVPNGHEDEVGAKIAQLVHTLEETEIPRIGGWAYARGGGRYEPSPASPFMTAPTLIALYEAAAQGEAVDNEVVQRALDSLEGSRTKQGNIPYSTDGVRPRSRSISPAGAASTVSEARSMPSSRTGSGSRSDAGRRAPTRRLTESLPTTSSTRTTTRLSRSSSWTRRSAPVIGRVSWNASSRSRRNPAAGTIASSPAVRTTVRRWPCSRCSSHGCLARRHGIRLRRRGGRSSGPRTLFPMTCPLPPSSGGDALPPQRVDSRGARSP